MKIKTLEVELDGIPGLHVRAEIVKVFLKYIVYERGLVPAHFDTLIRTPYEQSKVNKSKINFIDSMTNVLKSIDVTFSHPVEEVLILLGGNIVCPQDTYRITFPSTCEAHLAESPPRKYVSEVMKALITWNELPTLSLPSSTAVHLFFLLPRNSELHGDHVLPNLSFQAPQSGNHFHINLSSKAFEELNSGLSSSLMSNISGIEPLETSERELNEEKIEEDISQSESVDLIWFKASVILKGYKEIIRPAF